MAEAPVYVGSLTHTFTVGAASETLILPSQTQIQFNAARVECFVPNAGIIFPPGAGFPVFITIVELIPYAMDMIEGIKIPCLGIISDANGQNADQTSRPIKMTSRNFDTLHGTWTVKCFFQDGTPFNVGANVTVTVSFWQVMFNSSTS